MPTINYEIVSQEAGHPLIIRDMSDVQGGMTVTNGVEAVVEELYKAGILTADRRLFYYDSAGSLDEILHQDGQFKDFKHGVD